MNHFKKLNKRLILNICTYLNLNDLNNLRNVIEQFKNINNEIKIKELIITDDYYFDNCWSYSNQFVDIRKSDIVKIDKYLKLKSIFNLKVNLKRLYLNCDHRFDLTYLNELINLEQLELSWCFKSNYYGDNQLNNYTINLPLLKVFNFKGTNQSNDHLQLNSPILNAFLYYPGSNSINLIHPESINYLETEYQIDDLNKYANLEYLHYHNPLQLKREILNILPKLMILSLDFDFSNYLDEEFYDYMKCKIRDIFFSRYKLNRANVKIYLNGIKLIQTSGIINFQYSSNRYGSEFYDLNDIRIDYLRLKYQFLNYDLLIDELLYDKSINYMDLIKLTDTFTYGFLPMDFFSRWVSVRCILVIINDEYNEFNQNHLFIFLSNLQCLKELIIKYAKLDQTFYNRLNEFKYLEILSINETNLEINKLDFQFLFKINELRTFEINQLSSNQLFNLVSQLFQDKRLKYFENLIYQNVNEYYYEFSKMNHQFNIRCYQIEFQYSINKLFLIDCNQIDIFALKGLNLNEFLNLSTKMILN